MVVPVLIHDCQTLDAPGLASSLGNIDDLRIEITGITGEFLIDQISNLVGQLAHRIHVGATGTRCQIAPGHHIPQNKFNLQLAVFIQLGRPDKQTLGAKRFPIGEIRLDRGRARRCDKGGLVNRFKQAGADQIIRDDRGNQPAFIRFLAIGAGKIGNCDRCGGDNPFGDLDPQLGVSGCNQYAQQCHQHGQRQRAVVHAALPDM